MTAGRTNSEWRLRARRRIRSVLARLPADADLKAKRRALREAYPFYERSGWPYQCWLKEQRAALGPAGKAGPAVVDWVVGASPTFHVRVRCDWCGRPEGCLACGPLVERWKELCDNADANALARACQAAPADPLPRLVFADWLEERGFDRPGELFRATCAGGML